MGVEPLVLLANADKWLTESLESVLTQGGYRVIVTAKRSQVLDVARRQLPDALLLDMALDQRTTDSLSLCRALRADPAISRATPIILTTAGPALRTQQLEALRAGAWELRGDPLDVEELVLRLGVYVQGKLEVDQSLGTEAIDLELPLDVDAEPQDQLFHVERIAAQLPRAGAQRFELLRAQRRPRGREDDRRRAGNGGIGAQRAAQRQTVGGALVERHVEQHGAGKLAPRELQHLRPLGRDDHAIAALREHALERLRQPLVGVGEED